MLKVFVTVLFCLLTCSSVFAADFKTSSYNVVVGGVIEDNGDPGAQHYQITGDGAASYTWSNSQTVQGIYDSTRLVFMDVSMADGITPVLDVNYVVNPPTADTSAPASTVNFVTFQYPVTATDSPVTVPLLDFNTWLAGLQSNFASSSPPALNLGPPLSFGVGALSALAFVLAMVMVI